MKILTQRISILSVLLMTACGGGGGDAPAPNNPPPPAPFSVTSVSPAAGTIGVDLEQVTTATFNHKVDGLTVNNMSTAVDDGTGPIIISKSSSNGTEFGTVSFTPLGRLDRNTLYTVYLKTSLKDTNGTPLEAAYEWSFTTSWTAQAIFDKTEDMVIDVATDSDGNIYALTKYIHGLGGYNLAVSKFNTSGERQWIYRLGSQTAVDDVPTAITATTDAVYIVGKTKGELLLNPSAGLNDIFVVRLKHTGTTAWVKQFGTAWDDFAFDVIADADTIYIAAATGGDFDGVGPDTHTGGMDALVLAVNQLDGSKKWSKQFGSSDNDFDYVTAITMSGANLYLAGETYGDINGSTSDTNFSDAFLASMPILGGDPTWTKQLGTAKNEMANRITTDGTSIYVTGSSEGDLPNMNGKPRVATNCKINEVDERPCSDYYVSKYSIDGTHQWTYLNGTEKDDIGYDILFDNGHLYIGGLAGGSIEGESFKGNYDMMVQKLDTNGTPVWTRLRSGKDSVDYDHAYGIAISGTNLYVGGFSNSNFDGHLNAGDYDGFVLKFDTDGTKY